MRRIVACLFACCAPLWAQFGSLSTVYDGSALYFTSRLAQVGMVQPDHGKVFVLDGSGVRLLLALDREVYRSSNWINLDAYTTNRYNLVGVDMAANGSKIAVVGRWECSGFTSGLCGSADVSTVYDDAGQQIGTYQGHVRLSRNGKWGLSVRTWLSSGAAAASYQLLDFQQNRLVDIGAVMGSREWRSGISDNGTTVITIMSGLVAVRDTYSPVTLLDGEREGSGVIDAAGVTAVTTARGKLTLFRLAAEGAPVVVSKEELGDGWSPQLSGDGSRLVFQSWWGVPQVLDLNAGRRARTVADDGGVQSVLSGDGRVLWVLKDSGAVAKIDVDSGDVREMMRPVAAFRPDRFEWRQATVPGHVVTFPTTVALAEDDVVTVGGVVTPVLQRERWSVTIQIPWELAADRPHAMAIRGQGAEQWTGASGDVLLSATFPQFTNLWDGKAYWTRADHGTERDNVSADSPAMGRELVRLYGTGFGAVPGAETGKPARQLPLANELACYEKASRVRLPVSYAGLAPGEIGVYRVDVTLPAVEKAGAMELECELVGVRGGYTKALATVPVMARHQ